MPLCASQPYTPVRYYSDSRHYSANWIVPSAPSNFTSTIACSRHYSAGTIKEPPLLLGRCSRKPFHRPYQPSHRGWDVRAQGPQPHAGEKNVRVVANRVVGRANPVLRNTWYQVLESGIGDGAVYEYEELLLRMHAVEFVLRLRCWRGVGKLSSSTCDGSRTTCTK